MKNSTNFMNIICISLIIILIGMNEYVIEESSIAKLIISILILILGLSTIIINIIEILKKQ